MRRVDDGQGNWLIASPEGLRRAGEGMYSMGRVALAGSPATPVRHPPRLGRKTP
jgi:hypothetical protein